MKRRSLLGLGALTALGLWVARPSDAGRVHNAYFGQLQGLLQAQGGGQPLLVIDLERLDANVAVLWQRLAKPLGRPSALPVRLVVNSLSSHGLLDYLSRALQTRRFMLFTQPQLLQLARRLPEADLLLGKPLPVDAALAFYQQMTAPGTFDPTRQLTWLIDTRQRLAEYAELAQALKQPLQIAFEIDVGMARGGFAAPGDLVQALAWLQSTSAPLRVRGLMGYDGHLQHSPPWVDQIDAHRESCARYQAFIEAAQATPGWPDQPLLNGAGSFSYALHCSQGTPLSEIALGSALLKPSAFDTPLLHAHRPAVWIASPVLKCQGGETPPLAVLQRLRQAWNPNRERIFFLDGGWSANPESPPGLRYDDDDAEDDRRGQARFSGSSGTGLTVDDWVFLRPRRAEGLLGAFNELRLLRHSRLVGTWSPLPPL
ncbi:MAG: alanine racemase [Pseudomonas sp.]|uniref:alanine racemase n=1 Tax=Pseudomonas sp. TaxID=306 RepID=UPI003395C2A6